MAGADLILENLPRDIEGKKAVFKKCKGASKEAIFATTATSGITELAADSERSPKFIGMHFTLSHTGNWLVQIAKGLETSKETIAACRQLVERVGATAVELEDSPGLILDRVMACLINEATLMYMTGIVASVEEIDEIVRVRRRWPMGPFQIADEMGIDRVVETLEILAEEMGSQYLPCRLLKRMVQAGWLGKKTAKGFYTYT